MFNDFNLNDDEIMKIIDDFKPLLLNNAMIKNKFDEDLYQELQIKIFSELSRNRIQKNKKN